MNYGNFISKLTKFMILDFYDIFYSENPILKVKVDILITGIRTYDINYTEMTPLGKVWQNKPLGLISYSRVYKFQYYKVKRCLFI